MPSKSKAQRRAAGLAHAAQKGEIPMSNLKGAAKDMAKMKPGDLKDFAKTKEDNLPEKVKKEELDAELQEMAKLAGIGEAMGPRGTNPDWLKNRSKQSNDIDSMMKTTPREKSSHLEVSYHQSLDSGIEDYLKSNGFKILKKEGPYSQRIRLNVVPKKSEDLFSYATKLQRELMNKFDNKYIQVQPY